MASLVVFVKLSLPYVKQVFPHVYFGSEVQKWSNGPVLGQKLVKKVSRYLPYVTGVNPPEWPAGFVKRSIHHVNRAPQSLVSNPTGTTCKLQFAGPH